MNWIFYIIFLAVVLTFVLHVIADGLNLKTLKGELASEFCHIYRKGRYAKFCAYEKVQIYFGWLDSGCKLIIFLAFWLVGGFNWLNNIILTFGLGVIPSGILFGLVILWANFIIEIPFNYYYTFVIEQKYGFNRTRQKTFVIDRIKVFVLTSVLVAVLFGILIWFFEKNLFLSWLWCWIVLCVFMFAIQWLVPNVIMPLFNKFSSLPEGGLRDLIFDYAKELDFSIKDVFIMDGSKRSAKMNAFVSGVGDNRRIVLYDTLLENCDDDEVLGVLAHEIGHMKLHHLRSGLIVQFIYMGVLLFLLSFFISSPDLYSAFFMETRPVYAGIIFFGLLYTPIDFFAGIVLNYFSRKKEFDADKFAFNSTGNSQSLVTMFEKLARLNLANVKPHWFYIMLNSTHPPLLLRITAVKNMDEGAAAD